MSAMNQFLAERQLSAAEIEIPGIMKEKIFLTCMTSETTGPPQLDCIIVWPKSSTDSITGNASR